MDLKSNIEFKWNKSHFPWEMWRYRYFVMAQIWDIQNSPLHWSCKVWRTFKSPFYLDVTFKRNAMLLCLDTEEQIKKFFIPWHKQIQRYHLPWQSLKYRYIYLEMKVKVFCLVKLMGIDYFLEAPAPFLTLYYWQSFGYYKPVHPPLPGVNSWSLD